MLTHAVLLELSLLVDAGCSASCNTDVGDAGAAEFEELADEPRTKIGTQFAVLHLTRLPSLMICGFWPVVHSKEYPLSVQSFPSEREQPVYLREALLSRMNPIL